MSSTNYLTKILEHKRNELVATKKCFQPSLLADYATEQGMPRGFLDALKNRVKARKPSVIAEIKRASPSKGVLCETLDPIGLVKKYQEGGATCLSVVTDKKFFQGGAPMIDIVRKYCPLPVLRKDFIIDPYQIHESRAVGADAVLLIMAALTDDGLLSELFSLASEDYGMDVLVEVHSQEELERAFSTLGSVPLVGINNRNLSSFSVSLETTFALSKSVPRSSIVVSESGIHTPEDITAIMQHGVFVALIGEALICAKDPKNKLLELIACEAPSEDANEDEAYSVPKLSAPDQVRPSHLGMHHLAMRIDKFEECMRFYVDILGYRVEWQPDQDSAYLTSGNDNLALHRRKTPRLGNGTDDTLDHLGLILASKDQVDRWYQYLCHKDVPIAKQPKDHRDGSRSFYCRAPDDTIVQFIYHPPILESLAPSSSHQLKS